jgi:hypothetical protein
MRKLRLPTIQDWHYCHYEQGKVNSFRKMKRPLMSGFFGRLPWATGNGGGGNNPNRQAASHWDPRGRGSYKEDMDFDFVKDREGIPPGGAYCHQELSSVDYEARRLAIFQPGGSGQHGQQQPPTIQDLSGGQGPPPDQNLVQEGGQQQQGFLGAAPPAAAAQLAPPLSQGGAQIMVLPSARTSALQPTGGGVKGGHPYSGIGAALKRLSAYGMTDKATSRNLKWQQNVNGDTNKAAA